MLDKEGFLKENLKHVNWVRLFMNYFSAELRTRAEIHDVSKTQPPELKQFVKSISKLKKLTYGSDKYKQALKELGPALEHHYEVNRHHPEHFKNGIDDMTVIDLVEMLADWLAAVKKHNDGDIYESLEINRKRFKMSNQVYNILKNTVDEIKKIEDGGKENG